MLLPSVPTELFSPQAWSCLQPQLWAGEVEVSSWSWVDLDGPWAAGRASSPQFPLSQGLLSRKLALPNHSSRQSVVWLPRAVQ